MYKFLFISALFFFNVNAYAANKGLIVPSSPCPKGSQNAMPDTLGFCNPVGSTALYGEGATIVLAGGYPLATTVFANTYVPASGSYFLRAHFCRSTSTSTCSVKNSSEFVDGIKAVNLDSTSSIDSQNPDWGGAKTKKTFDYSFNMCYVIVDVNNNEWSQGTLRECRDALVLPSEPGKCSVQSELSFDVGELQRSDIPTQPSQGSQGNTEKSFAVACSSNVNQTVSIKFQYSALSVGGDSVIKSSSNGVGVAMFYQGSIVSPSAVYTEKFSSGLANYNIEFQVVRDPNVSIAAIPAGSFTASAVMVVTVQ